MTELPEGVCARPRESAPSGARRRVERTWGFSEGKRLNLVSGFTCHCRHSLLLHTVSSLT